MRVGVLLFVVAACGRPPPLAPPELAGPEPMDTYNTRISDLRSTLGRAGIGLRVAGLDEAFESCNTPIPSAGTCVRCELAGERTAMDGAVIEATTRAFKVYPTDVLVASKIDHVAVCRELRYTQPHEFEHPAGVADLRGRGLLISVRYFLGEDYANRRFNIDDIAHHEVFHLIEHEHMSEDLRGNDPEWHLHNPIGFEYSVSLNKESRRKGFVNSYAMTSAIEDRASVYEFMMAHPEELCDMARYDEVLQIKTRIIWRRMFRALGTDKFIRDAAPCIDWLDDA